MAADLLALLRNSPLFNELTDKELEHVATIANRHVFSKRQYIFMEGEEREAVYFIQHGTVKIFKINESGNEQIINILQEGEMFPHIGFFDTAIPYPATAEVIEKAELLVIRIEDFDHLLIRQPAIALKVMKMMGRELVMLQQRVQELISQDVGHRLIRVLLRLAHESGKTEKNGIRINIPITNQDFANIVGSSRETVNRLLNGLKKEKLVESDRHGFLIYDIQKLKNHLAK